MKRLEQIIKLVSEYEKIDVNTLSEKLNVSKVTIRKDLDKLESKGLLHREHGYAVLNSGDDLNVRLSINYETKRKIVQEAVKLVSDNETIMIESGSTCALLAEEICKQIGIAFFISFLWWFGVHGQSVVNGVVTALLLSNLDANKAMLASGNLSLENGAHIVTQQFLDSFLILSGSGITFGLVVAMLFAAKSKQYQALGKVAAFPAIFNVNEPVVFGFPIVMNPVMFVPFILVPVLAAVIVYGAIATGFMQPFSGVTLPWSTPAILSGFLVGGWQGVVTQLLVLVISTVVYFPFFKIQDRLAYQNEIKQS